jgi:hypothetical protein
MHKYKTIVITTLIVLVLYLSAYLLFRQSEYFVEEWGVAGDDGINPDIILIDDSKIIGKCGWYAFYPLERIEGIIRMKLIINSGSLDAPNTINEWLRDNGKI